MEQGLVDADLGGNVYKKRIPLPGRGKSRSTRTLLATNKENRWIFLFGFEKNDRDNITQAELLFLQGITHDLLKIPEQALLAAIDRGEIEEIECE